MSNEINIKYTSNMHAEVKSPATASTLAIDAPGGCGGSGASFSPKLIVAAAYGSCVIMPMDMEARKNNFDIAGADAKVSLDMVLRDKPYIDKVEAIIILPRQYTDEQIDILRKGAGYCPIHNSLAPEVKTTLTFEVA